VLSGGFLADRWLKQTSGGRLLTVGLSFALGSLPAIGAIFAPDFRMFLLLSALALYFYTFYFPCMGPMMHQVTLPTMRATAFGFYLLLVHLLGSAPAPAMVGWISDRVGDLRLGISLVPVVALIGSLVALWGSRYIGEDTRRMQERLRSLVG
jgi:MFS family permease